MKEHHLIRVKCLALLLYGSNLDLETAILTEIFRGFSQFLQ
jgi:hypothetical protein